MKLLSVTVFFNRSIKLYFYIFILFLPLTLCSSHKNALIPKNFQFDESIEQNDSLLHLTDLPTDVLCKIATFITDRNILKLRLVCKNLNSRFSTTNFNQQTLPFPTIHITDRTIESKKQFAHLKKILNRLQKGSCPIVPNSVDLSKTTITDKKLNALFRALPKLKILNLESCFFLNKPNWKKLDFTTRPVVHNQVISLNIYNCNPTLLTTLPLSIFRNLKTINLGLSNITDSQLEALIKQCPHITSLGLRMCTELNFEKTPWEKLSRLKDINVSGSNINDAALRPLPTYCTKLKKLNVNSCYDIALTDFVWNCKTLTALKGHTTKINTENLDNLLTACHKLENLNLAWCTNINILDFVKKKFASLKKINLSHTHVTDSQLEQILKNNPRLTKLHLYSTSSLEFKKTLSWANVLKLKDLNAGGTKIDDQQLVTILNHCTNLTKLKLSSCQFISIKNLKPSSRLKLKTLLLDNTKFIDATLNNVLSATPELKNLNLCLCKNLLFESIKWGLVPQLKTLNLWKTSISDTGLAEILKKLPLLEELLLNECQKLTFGVFPWHELKNLKILSLNNTSITEDALRKLLKVCPHLKTISVFYCTELQRSSNLPKEFPHVNFQYW